MSSELTRRAFLRASAFTLFTTAAASGIGGRLVFGQDKTAAPAQQPLYAFPLLGDLHYDKFEHHDMDWVAREKGDGDVRQIKGYVATTEQHTPRLLAQVAQAIRASTAPVPFVVQLGDLVEGLCGSYDLQAKQFNDCFALLADAKLGALILTTKGNHDITGPGAPEAFDRVLLPWLGKQANQQLNSANYIVRQHDDLLVFFDGYKPNLDWLEQTLSQNQARRVFFIVHQPVVPYNARANWILFGQEKQAADRARLIQLLGQYNAIVLSGHLHKYSLLRRATDGGGVITQLAISSIIRNQEERPRNELEGVAAYGEQLVQTEPDFAQTTVDRRRKLLADERPAIQSFSYADVPGYAMVKVYADRVDADLFVGTSTDKWKTDAIGSPKVQG